MEAVMFREGALLVIAGAGSGKTRTLTYRVAPLPIRYCGVMQENSAFPTDTPSSIARMPRI